MQGDGFWCEVSATSGDHSRAILLGSYRAKNARLAVRWLREQAAKIAHALDPDSGTWWLRNAPLREVPAALGKPDPAAALRQWRRSWPRQEEALSLLLRDELFAFVTYDETAYYCLSARTTQGAFLDQWRYDPPIPTCQAAFTGSQRSTSLFLTVSRPVCSAHEAGAGRSPQPHSLLIPHG